MAAQLEELRVSFRDDVSRGAEAAAAALAKMGGAAEAAGEATRQTEEVVRRAGASAEQLARRYNDAERAAAAKEAAERRHARALEDVERLEKAGAITAEAAAQRRSEIARRAELDAARIAAAAERRAQAEARLLGGGATAAPGASSVVVAERNLTALATANDNVATSSGRMGQTIASAGMQLQDFAIQAQMGVSPLTALAQQGSQFLSMFGTGGAVAGAVLAFAAIGLQLTTAREASDQLNDAIKRTSEIYRETEEAARAYRDGLDEEGRRILALRTYYATLNEERRAFERERLASARSELEGARNRVVQDAVDEVSRPGVGASAIATRQLLDLRSESARRRQAFAPSAQQTELAAIGYELRALAAAGELTADRLIVLQERLRSAGAAGGELGEAARDTAQALTPVIERLARSDAELARVNTQMALAAGEGLPGVTRGFSGASAAAGQFATEMERIARINVNDPLASIERGIGQTQEQLVALRRGGLDELGRVRDEQERARSGEEAYNRVLREQREELQKLGVAREDIEQRAIQAAEAARLREQERIRGVQQLRDEEGKARDARQEAERAAREGAQAQRREEEELQRAYQRSEEMARRAAQTALDTARRQQDQAREQTRREEQRAQQEIDRTVERYSDNLADATYDGLEAGAARGASVFEMLANVARAAFRRAFADVLSSQVYQPVIRSFVGGSGGLTSTGGVAGGASGGIGGGIMQLLGLNNLGSQVGSMLGLGDLGSGLSALLSTPIFGYEALSSATSSALGAMGGMYGPATASQLGMAGTTWGSALGGIGMGFGVGTMIGGLVAQSPAQQTNSMIGSAMGSIGGFLIGGPIGALIGGALGGGIGGLFGPSRAFSGGDVLVDVDEEGQLVVRGSVSKRYDMTEAEQAAEEQVKQINRLLEQLNLRFGQADETGGDYDALVGAGQSGNARTVADALDEWGVTDRLTSDNANVQRAIDYLNEQEDTTLEDLLTAAQWVQEVYDSLASTEGPASAYEQALERINDTYEEAIEQAEEYGLATEQLVANQQAAVDELNEQRDQAIANSAASVEARYQRAYGNAAEAADIEMESRFRQEREALTAALEELSASAEETAAQLQLLSAAQEEERRQVEEQRARGIANTIASVEARYQRAMGNTRGAQNILIELQFQQEREALVASLEALGASAEETAAAVQRLGEAQDEERRQLQRAQDTEEARTLSSIYASALSQSRILSDWLNAQAITYGSPETALRNAQQQFADAVTAARAAGGQQADLGRVTSAASTLIDASRGFYATSAEGAALEAWVRETVRNLGAQLDIPGFTEDVTATIRRWGEAQVDELTQIREGINGMWEELRRISLLQRAA